MSSPRVTFNLTCGKGVTELQNLTNLRLSSFAKSHQMQQKCFDVYPKLNTNFFLLCPTMNTFIKVISAVGKCNQNVSSISVSMYKTVLNIILYQVTLLLHKDADY